MSRALRVAVACVVLTACLSGGQSVTTGEGSSDSDDGDDHPKQAQHLLRRVRAALPSVPVDVSGDAMVTAPNGRVLARADFAMRADWSRRPARLDCALLDADGNPTQRVRMLLSEGEALAIVLIETDGTEGAALNAGDPVGPTGLTWSDLALSFLWWPGGTVVDTGRVKGQLCDVVEIPAPSHADDAPSGYASARLWISRDYGMPMRVDGFDTNEELVRSLRVRSLRKADGHWMIGELEVRGRGTGPVTRLRIREMSLLETP